MSVLSVLYTLQANRSTTEDILSDEEMDAMGVDLDAVALVAMDRPYESCEELVPEHVAFGPDRDEDDVDFSFNDDLVSYDWPF